MADFGVLPNTGADLTARIQQAITAVGTNGVLFFPAGKYQHNSRIIVGTPGVKLVGLQGAVLDGTNIAEQAVFIAADNVGVHCFTMTAATAQRDSTPWSCRIAVYPHFDASKWISGVEITGNSVLANGSNGGASSCGIMVFKGDNFKIIGNRVNRSLADGIHMTGGSRYGEVAYNDVWETGDDQIAVVSYLPVDADTFSRYSTSQVADARATTVAHNVSVHHNKVWSALWGRGITVVGGTNVTIQSNSIRDTQMAAGIYVAREWYWNTWGGQDIDILGNTIEANETTDTAGQTSQGAIEVNSMIQSLAKTPMIVENLGVTRVRIQGNTIASTRYGGIRISNTPGDTPTNPEMTSAISVTGNALTAIGGDKKIWMNLLNSARTSSCTGNTVDGAAYSCLLTP